MRTIIIHQGVEATILGGGVTCAQAVIRQDIETMLLFYRRTPYAEVDPDMDKALFLQERFGVVIKEPEGEAKNA